VHCLPDTSTGKVQSSEVDDVVVGSSGTVVVSSDDVPAEVVVSVVSVEVVISVVVAQGTSTTLQLIVCDKSGTLAMVTVPSCVVTSGFSLHFLVVFIFISISPVMVPTTTVCSMRVKV